MSFTLLILAGGLGSRFNGSKQIEGIGPNGELLLEYSIYDALWQGCSKVVILSNPECIPKLQLKLNYLTDKVNICLLYTSPSPRDISGSRMPSSA